MAVLYYRAALKILSKILQENASHWLFCAKFAVRHDRLTAENLRNPVLRTFIRVIEIWTPTPDKRGLALADAIYGKYDELKKVSEQRIFNFDEGLPGKAWSSASPQIITDLANSYFRRKDEAARAGLNVGIAIPIFVGEFLLAVVVLLCSEKSSEEKILAGAIELWTKKNEKSSELGLVDGYYGSLKKLEEASRNIQFARGSGLPGSVWDYRIPMLVSDMSDSSLFKRASTAAIEGITSAIGLPLFYFTNKEYVLTFLSAHSTPIALRFEIWIPDRERDFLFFYAGACEQGEDISALYQNKHIKRGTGLIGKVWLTGVPAISKNLTSDGLINEDSKSGLTTGFVMPIIEEGFLKSIVAFMF